jgi:hypothetical protein
MENNILKIIGKYALILAFFYAIELVIGHSYKYLLIEGGEYYINEIIAGLPVFIKVIFNVFVSIVLFIDKKKYSVEGKYSILLTLFFRPIGVTLFLIYLIHSDLKKVPAPNNK